MIDCTIRGVWHVYRKHKKRSQPYKDRQTMELFLWSLPSLKLNIIHWKSEILDSLTAKRCAILDVYNNKKERYRRALFIFA